MLVMALWIVVGIVSLYLVIRLGLAWLVPDRHRKD
jgi:hypothetical protein